LTRPRVIVTRKLPQAVEERLRRHFTVALNPRDAPFSTARLIRALQEADGLLCSVTDLMDEAILAAEGRRRTRILANFGVGVNHIDLDAAEAAGIAVTNTPGVLTDATADLAVALMLAATRRMSETEAALRRGEWHGFRPTGWLGMALQDRVLGIVGMGRIGQAVARRAALGFGMKVIYHSRSAVGPFADFAAERRPSLEAVLAEADVVSLHVPGGAATRGLIAAERLALMKPTAYLVNTARGDVVDEAALIEALRARRIAGAGLDVYAEEPHVPAALLALPNVTLLPHIGSATLEARTAMGMLACDNLLAFFDGRPPPTRVV
jgi:lactate dehydrogenase-like 2-hydroxyacid dehydrogenase